MQISDSALNDAINQNFFQISEDGQQVVFLSTQNFAQELFSVSTNEGSVIRLNPNLVDSGNVTVSSAVSRPLSPFQITPDNQQVVYIADQVSNDQFELFIVPITGGTAVRLNADLPVGGDVAAIGSATDFQISSDGQRVVYIADQNEDNLFELFSVPLTGTGGAPTRLNANLSGVSSDVVDFQISPDGLRVLYLADQNNNEMFELFSVAITGGNVERLNGALTTQGDVDAFQISPDSLRVVYQADQNVFGDDELFSVPIAGGSATQLNSDFVVSGGANSSDVVGFQISSNSQQVVYLADQNINNTFELFSVPIVGGTAVRLNDDIIEGGDVTEEFDISADSLNVVYIADQITDDDFELFSVPLSGGSVAQLSPTNTTIVSSQFLSLLPDNAFTISADGQQVVFLADFSGGTGQLFSVPVTGGTAVTIDSVAPGDVTEDFQISADSQRVLFSSQTSPTNLFSIAIAGGTTEQVNGELPFGGSVSNFAISNDGQRVIYSANQTDVFRLDLFSAGDFAAPAAAVLPSSRSVLVGNSATAFATVININSETLQGCSVAPPPGIAADFFYQTTDPSTNGVIGQPNTPAAILPGEVQTYIFGFTPTSAIEPAEVALRFDCTNSLAASVFEGVNTLLLSGSETPVPDIVALVATTTGDGILTLPSANSSAAFAVASVNVGSSATIVVTPDTGSANPPLTLTICQTNSLTAMCLAAPTATVESIVTSNATPTFSVFVTANGNVAFDPANTRIRVRFLEAGEVRGSTSVAVQTQ